MFAGGGVAGIIDFPLYMSTMHGLWLTQCNLILQAALAGASPYAAAFAYNPEPDLDAFLDQWEVLDALVNAYGTDAWDDLVTTAGTQVDAVLADDSFIDDEVAAFDASQVARLQRSVGRLAAGMSDAGAAVTNGYIFGVAMLELENAKQSDALEAQLRRERAAQRPALVLEATNQLLGMLANEIEQRSMATRLRGELAKMTIASQSARLSEELQIDVEDAKWDLSLFAHPGNLLASISGAVVTADHKSLGQQGASNALGLISSLGPLIGAL